jgi:hypothetical protein
MYNAQSYPIYAVIDRDGTSAPNSVALPAKLRCEGC